MPLRIQLDHGRSLHDLMADIRNRMAIFSADLNVTQFLMDRTQAQDNMVRGDVVVKLFGADLPMLRTLAYRLREEMSRVKGLVDLEVEQQTYSPQARIAIDYARAKLFGITPAQLTDLLSGFANGRTVSQVIENGRRFDVTLQARRFRPHAGGARPAAHRYAGRGDPAVLLCHADLDLWAEPYPARGRRAADCRDGEFRRAERPAQLVTQVREIVARMEMPVGFRVALKGDFKLGEQGRRVLSVLGPLAILLIFVVLQQRFRSVVLSLIIMGNIPLALVGSVTAVWLAGLDLNLAAIIGFIAVTGVAVRNSLLKVSHFINLHLHEGVPPTRALVLRGSNERLIPVLMTATAAGAALVPLLFASDVAGAEILHPVAVALFGGLIDSTLLDTFTTPMLFELYGIRALDKMIATHARLARETF